MLMLNQIVFAKPLRTLCNEKLFLIQAEIKVTRMLFRSLVLPCALLASCATAGTPRTHVGLVQVEAGTRLYYQTIGNGPEVIIVPGRLFFGNQIQMLAGPGRTLVLYDMRNRGESSSLGEGAGHTILDDVADLEAVRTHVKAEKISIVGYSYLGLVAAIYASDHPKRVRRIVQIGPVPRQVTPEHFASRGKGFDTLSDKGKEAWARWLAAQKSPNGRSVLDMCRLNAQAMAYWLVGNPRNARKVPDLCRFENETPGHLDRHFTALWTDVMRNRSFPVEKFAGINTPVLVIHGTLDRNAPFEGGQDWARTWSDARFLGLNGAAHNVWLDDRWILNDISTFLAGRWPTRAKAISHPEPSK